MKHRRPIGNCDELRPLLLPFCRQEAKLNDDSFFLEDDSDCVAALPSLRGASSMADSFHSTELI
jgi:hypothetical protein